MAAAEDKADKIDRANEVTTSEQVAVHPVTAADAALGRVAARLSTLYFLRFAKMIADQAGGDLIEALVMHAIMAGNIGYLDQDPANAGKFSALDDVPPDAMRRPISVLAVAGSVGIPYETVRRHVNRLVKAGRCERVKGGVVVRSARMREPGKDADILYNMANLRRLYRSLIRAGVNFD